MKFLTSLFLIVALAAPVVAIGPGTRHDNQRGKGHANHQGNGWGHHEKPTKPPCETEQCEPRPPHKHRHRHNNWNNNRNTNTNTNRQSQGQSVANNIDIAFGDIGSGGTAMAGGFGWGYAQDTWRPIYQATPWQPMVAPIQLIHQYQQQRPIAKTYLAAPSFMYGGKRFVIME